MLLYLSKQLSGYDYYMKSEADLFVLSKKNL